MGSQTFAQIAPDRLIGVFTQSQEDLAQYGPQSFRMQSDFRHAARVGIRYTSPEFIGAYKIKEISMKDTAGRPHFIFQFNEGGTILSEDRYDYSGRFHFDRIVVQYSIDPSQKNTYYYRNDSLQRVDSVSYFYKDCNPYSCIWAETQSYFSGEHLNRQNRFYHENYYQVEVNTYGGRNRGLQDQQYYLDRQFPQDYRKDQLYFYLEGRHCQRSCEEEGCCPERLLVHHLPEAAFSEPDLSTDPPDCGNNFHSPPSVLYENILDTRGFIVRLDRVLIQHDTYEPPPPSALETDEEMELPDPPNQPYFVEVSRKKEAAFTIAYKFYKK